MLGPAVCRDSLRFPRDSSTIGMRSQERPKNNQPCFHDKVTSGFGL